MPAPRPAHDYAEAALLDKDRPEHRKFARLAKVSLGWMSHLYYWIYPGIMVAYTATIAGYLWNAVTGRTLSYPVLAVIAIVFAMLSGYIAFRGISGSTNTALAITVIQLAAIAAFTVFAIYFRMSHPALHYEHASALSVVAPHSFVNIIYQSTIAILLLVGFESVTALGAEAVNPDKDIKRGVLISLAIQALVAYMAQYFAANFAISAETITAKTASGAQVAGLAAAAIDSAPIGTMLTNMVNTVFGGAGTAVAVVFCLTVLLALIGTTLACLNAGVRITYSMARDKEVPSILGLTHGKFATPHAGISDPCRSVRRLRCVRCLQRRHRHPKSPWRQTSAPSWCMERPASSRSSRLRAIRTGTSSSTTQSPGLACS